MSDSARADAVIEQVIQAAIVPIEGKLTLPVKPEEYFPMSERDWKRLRSRIATFQQHRREFSAIAWACVGVLVSAIFTALTWAPAYRAMKSTESTEFAWVWPAIIALGAFGLVLGAMMFWASHITAVAEQATASEILDEMDTIHAVTP